MSLSFPKGENRTGIVGQTPWSARVPLDPPADNQTSRRGRRLQTWGSVPRCRLIGRYAGVRAPRLPLVDEFHLVLFDHWIGEHIARDLIDLGSGLGAIGPWLQRELEKL